MEYLLVGLASAAAAGLTLFSGFGLGTLLLPVFALFFPVELAVALTAIVHFLNNALKLVLLGGYADRATLLRFGLLALLGAFAGAKVLLWLSDLAPLATYSLGTMRVEIMPVKLTIAVLLIGFALFELVPTLKDLAFEKKLLPLGGLVSGFFGGLSGHQGALRSAFLIRCGLTKEQFLGTGIVIACVVDVSRISVYATDFLWAGITDEAVLLATAVGCAFLGTLLGNYLVRQVTLGAIQVLVSIMLFCIAVGLGMGFL